MPKLTVGALMALLAPHDRNKEVAVLIDLDPRGDRTSLTPVVGVDSYLDASTVNLFVEPLDDVKQALERGNPDVIVAESGALSFAARCPCGKMTANDCAGECGFGRVSAMDAFAFRRHY